MLRSIRLRGLLFTVLFCSFIVITIRVIQIQYTRAIIWSSFDEQIRTRLAILGAVPQLHQTGNLPGPTDADKTVGSELIGGQLPQEFFQGKILNYPLEFFWGIRGQDGKVHGGQQLPGVIPGEAFDTKEYSPCWDGKVGEIEFRIHHKPLPSGEIAFVGGSITAVKGPLDYFLYLNIFVGALLVSIITLGIWLILGQIFKPLTKISKIAQNIGKGKLSSRIVISEIDIELKPVGQSLNDMLDRLEQTIEAHAHYNSEVSHELLSPLNRIISILREATDDAPTGSDLHQKLLECQTAVKKTTTLASDLLELARSESASSHTHVWIDLEPVIDEAIGEVEMLAREKELRIELTSSTAGVLANPIQIHQVALNLLSNAIKFAPPKSTIHVSIKKVNDQVQLGVTDSGPGIPPEESKDLFKRFFRTKAHSTRDITGNGLGLAICRNIIDQHQGVIRYERTPDGLTLFEVLFPPRQDQGIS